jgi:hypothetical protein
MPELIKEFEYFVDVGVIDEVGPGPFGQRGIGNYTGGQFFGDRLKGTIVGASADWSLQGQDGFNRRDERLTFKTVDGALIYVQALGLTELTPALIDIVEGGDTPTNFGDQYFFNNPRLETGDERYSWVNQTMFIGQGRLLPAPRATPQGRVRVEFRVYRVANC